MSENVKESVEFVNDLARGFMRSRVLFEAHQAGVFPLLEDPRTAEDIAGAVGWTPRGARILLDGLFALKLIEKEGGCYHNGRHVSTCLVPGKPGYQGHLLSHLHNLEPRWDRMGDALRSGRGAVESEALRRGPEELRDFILGMSDIAKFSAREILQACDFSKYRHLLDLGGGPATYAITFLQKYEAMRATLFDFPDVIAIAREQVAEAALEDRMAYVCGDMTSDDIGTGYDLVLVSNIIHSFGPEANRALVRKCHAALAPGGLLVIKDFLIDDDRTGPPFGLMFALNMLVGTEAGDTYTFAEVDAWTREAGFAEGRAVHITPQSRLWLAEKS